MSSQPGFQARLQANDHPSIQVASQGSNLAVSSYRTAKIVSSMRMKGKREGDQSKNDFNNTQKTDQKEEWNLDKDWDWEHFVACRVKDLR